MADGVLSIEDLEARILRLEEGIGIERLGSGEHIVASRGVAVNVNELDDVVLASPADNELLTYNLADTTWKNNTADEAGLPSNEGTAVAINVSGTPADNEILAYDSGTSKWINQTDTEARIGTLIDESHVVNNLTSSSTETSMVTTTIPANLMGTDDGVHWKIFVSSFVVVSGASLALKFNLDGTELFTQGVTGEVAADVRGVIDLYVFADTDTDNQYVRMYSNMWEVGEGTGQTINFASDYQSTGAPTKDSTGALGLELTAKFSNASANIFETEGFLLQKLI